MTQFFNKAACFTDIHFGMKNNARQHNIDCENFVTWFIEEAKKRGSETCIFLGDWHHQRSSVNVSTLNYSISNLKKLGEAFEKVYFIVGNHDLFYRDKREISSVVFADEIPNIKVVSDWIIQDDVAVIPWLFGDEWKTVQKVKCKYMFGHFELPHFKMNAMVEMPDIGTISSYHFKNAGHVFTGHFHKDNTVVIYPILVIRFRTTLQMYGTMIEVQCFLNGTNSLNIKYGLMLQNIDQLI
mgnify:CR=1 FL=1